MRAEYKVDHSAMCQRTMEAQSGAVAGVAQGEAVVRRNRRLGILNGVIGQIGVDFLHPELILAGMITALTGNVFLVALITIISKAGMLAPQLLVGSFLEHRARRRPYYFGLLVARGFGYIVMVGSIYWMATGALSQNVGLTLFFLAYLSVCIFMGGAHVIFQDMVGRIIPIERLGGFLGTRNFVGGLLAFVTALAVLQPIVEWKAVPINYLVLFIIGGVVMIVASSIFCMTHEQDGPRAKERTTLRESLSRGVNWLRTDRNYRCYLWLRVAFRISYVGLAFFVPYGVERLQSARGASDMLALGGITVAVHKLSRVLSAFVWGKLADRREFRTCLLGAGVAFLLMPVLALAAPMLPELFVVRVPFTQTAALNLPLCVYLLALAAWGAGTQASIIGGQRFLIGSAPPHRRLSYVGFLNTITSPLTLVPLAGAGLAAAFGIWTVFFVVAAASVFYLVNVLRMIPEKKAVARRDEVLADEFYDPGS